MIKVFNKGDKMKESNMNVIISTELKIEAKKKALDLNITLREFIMEAIKEKLNKKEN